MAAMSLEGLCFMNGDEFPPNNVLGNSEVPRHSKGPWSLCFAGAPALYMFVLASLG
jgi:hypothetical protein